METTDIKVEGLAELDKALKQFSVELADDIVRVGLRTAAGVIRKRAREAAPIKTGALRQSIRVQTKLNKQNGSIVANIYTTKFYANMIEYGTKAHKIVPRKAEALSFDGGEWGEVNHPGIRPRAFMRKALDTADKEALERFAAYLRKRIPKEVEKIASRTNSKRTAKR